LKTIAKLRIDFYLIDMFMQTNVGEPAKSFIEKELLEIISSSSAFDVGDITVHHSPRSWGTGLPYGLPTRRTGHKIIHLI
jgi:hypothetical protein